MNATDKTAEPRRLGREGEHPRGDLGQIILLFVFLAVWIADSFILRLSTQLTSFVPLGLRLGISGLVFLAALGCAQKGHIVVSGEVLRRGRLVKDGIFARVRHPLYLAALLFYASLVVTTLSLASLSFLGGIAVFYNAIASYEERFLIHKYGDEYRAYRLRVPKWIPRFRISASD